MNSMVYFNTELSEVEKTRLLVSLKKEGIKDDEIISMVSLNNQASINELLQVLQYSKELRVYDYQSLSLTIFEFSKLYTVLEKNQIVLRFIKEKEAFLDIFQLVIVQEKSVSSKRMKESAREAKKNNRTWGRPTIDQTIQKKIYRLYHIEKKSIREVARYCNVSVGTVSKYIKMEN